MPWSRKQVRYLLSNDSPLSGDQRQKMLDELHADPSMGHARKGSVELKKNRDTVAYDWRQREGLKQNRKH